MGKIGRNELCHCGSGKKYKNCHQQIDSQKGPSKKNLVIGSIIAVIFLIVVITVYVSNQSSGNGAPGTAPAGKVWSEEHGHWHNI